MNSEYEQIELNVLVYSWDQLNTRVYDDDDDDDDDVDDEWIDRWFDDAEERNPNESN